MKIIGFVIIALLVASLCIGLYALVAQPTSIVSPVPQKSGIKVIQATPTVSVNK